MVIDYLGEFIVYEELFINDKKFVLIHGGLKGFDPNKDLDDYSIWNRLDYNKIYYSNRYLVTGYTPTQSISGVNPGHVFKKNNHLFKFLP